MDPTPGPASAGSGAQSAEPLLQARGIVKRFGGVTALAEVDLDVPPSAIALVLGPNGAGKTTLINCVTGVDRPAGGTVRIAGRDLTGARADEFARAGAMRTFQHARPFRGLTLAENVMVGAHSRSGAGPLRGTLRTPSARREERRLHARAGELLAEVGLADRAGAAPADLTLADERRLEIARCLAGEPRLLFLDEPAAGLGEHEAQALGSLILRLRDERGVAVVLIEHHLELALSLADTVTVLDFGRVLATGTPAEIRANAAVQQAYLGVAG